MLVATLLIVLSCHMLIPFSAAYFQEIANSIEKPKRQQLAGFVDAIEEILVQEMQAELKTGYSNS